MEKGLFLFLFDSSKTKNFGLKSKCISQLKAFRNSGIEVDSIFNTREGLIFNEKETILEAPTSTFFFNVFAIFFYFRGYYKTIYNKLPFDQYSFVCLRYQYCTPFLLWFFRRIKRNHPNIHIYLEIATYPYDIEYNSFPKTFVLFIDQFFRRKLKFYVDKIYSCTNESYIYGIPVIKFFNGIDIDQIVFRESHKNLSNKLKLVAIASNISSWHGFDRIIMGLHQYYQKETTMDITLSIIGEGDEKSNLMDRVLSLQLDKKVTFLGFRPEKEINAVLSQSDLAIGTLGIHRKKVFFNSSLKHRHYCKIGIPFIASTIDQSFPADIPFIKYFAPDDTPIDICKLIDYFFSIEPIYDTISHEMTQYCKDYLSWNQTMKPVIDNIRKCTQTSKRSLFIVNYYFPPIHSPSYVRLQNFSYNMALNNHRIFAVSTSNSKSIFKSIPTSFHNNIKVFLAYTYDVRTFLAQFVKKSPEKKEQSGAPQQGFFSKLVNTFPFNVFLEGGLFYFIRVLYFAFKLRGQYQIIFSSFRPMTDHMIAFVLKMVNPSLYWIADFRDLHLDHDTKPYLLKSLQIWVSKRIYKKADMVTTVSTGLAKNIHSEFAEANVFVLRNGIESIDENVQAPDIERVAKEEYFNISYTGNLYKGKRDPEILFAAMHQLILQGRVNANDIRFHYAGEEFNIVERIASKYGLQSNIHNLGFIPRHESLKLQADSNINLLLSWSTKSQKGLLTGKFYEYLNAKKPVIVIISGEHDEEFENIVADTRIGSVFYHEDIEKLSNYFENLYVNWKLDPKQNAFKNEVNADNYKWEYNIHNLLTTIDQEMRKK